MMKRGLAICAMAVATVALPHVGHAQQPTTAPFRMDGIWWQSLKNDDARRLGYVMGYLDGIEMGTVLAAGAEGAKAVLALVLPSRVTFGQFVEGIDAFYADYRNDRTTPVSAAILRVARDIMERQPKDSPFAKP